MRNVTQTFHCCEQKFKKRKDFIAHMTTAHGLDIVHKDLHELALVRHWDGPYEYGSTYELRWPTVTATCVEVGKRDKDDPMRGPEV